MTKQTIRPPDQFAYFSKKGIHGGGPFEQPVIPGQRHDAGVQIFRITEETMSRYSNSCKAVFAFLFTLLPVSTATAEIPWRTSPESALRSAQQSGKPILVFVTTDWCHFCKKMKRDTWSDPRVDAAVSGQFETLVLDGDRDKKIVGKLGLRGYPATLIYTPGGHFVEQKGGYIAPEVALRWFSSIRR